LSTSGAAAPDIHKSLDPRRIGIHNPLEGPRASR